MLIESHRHTAADIALWREYEAADAAHSVRTARVDEAVAAIRSFGGDYVGCSWGKDSVTLLHILELSGCRLPVVWVRMRGRDNPDCESVRDAALARWPIDYHERVFRYEDCPRDEHWRSVDTEFGERRITGLRMDESLTRRMSVLHLGIATRRSCRPLAMWDGSDIYSWCHHHGLPLHPAYAMLGGGRWDRRYLRTHGIGGRSGTDRGRGEWEREYYGDVLAMQASQK